VLTSSASVKKYRGTGRKRQRSVVRFHCLPIIFSNCIKRQQLCYFIFQRLNCISNVDYIYSKLQRHSQNIFRHIPHTPRQKKEKSKKGKRNKNYKKAKVKSQNRVNGSLKPTIPISGTKIMPKHSHWELLVLAGNMCVDIVRKPSP
jgi:hypothetical protein